MLAAAVTVPKTGIGAARDRAAPIRLAAFTEPSNMALEFWRVWQGMDWNVDSKLIGDNLKNASWTPDAELSAVLAGMQEGSIPRLLTACNGKPSDWGLDADQGIFELLPHLGRLRATGRILAADARRLMAAGKTDDAVARVVAILHLPRHLTRDQVLISTLVAQAISEIGMEEAKRILTMSQGGDAAKRAFLAAVADLDATDPYRFREAIAGERTVFIGWMKKTMLGPNGHAALEKSLETMGDVGSDKETAKALLAMDQAALAADLEKADGAYDDILKVWDQPNFAEEVKVIATGIKNGKYGMVAKVFAPGLDKVAKRRDEGVKQLQAFRRELGAK